MNSRPVVDEKIKKDFDEAIEKTFGVSHSYIDTVKNIPEEFAKLLYLDAKIGREDIKSQALLRFVALCYDPEKEYPEGYLEDQKNRTLSRVDRMCDDIIETYESLYEKEEE